MDKTKMIQDRGKPHGQDLRIGRFSEPGRVYVITMVSLDRQPVFAHFAIARFVIQVMMGHESRGFARTFCFVVMPDHVHWMMQLGGKKKLAEAVQSLKSMISRKAGRPVFQKGYYDHALRREEDVKALARYIVANPLRSGLVDNINDYPHWDAVWL